MVLLEVLRNKHASIKHQLKSSRVRVDVSKQLNEEVSSQGPEQSVKRAAAIIYQGSFFGFLVACCSFTSKTWLTIKAAPRRKVSRSTEFAAQITYDTENKDLTRGRRKIISRITTSPPTFPALRYNPLS